MNRSTLIQEMEYHQKMLKNLNKWLRVLLLITSLTISYYVCFSPSHFLLKLTTIIIMVLGILGSIIVGYAAYNGHNHLNKLNAQLK